MALRRSSRKPSRVPFRPNLVHLEAREVPATLTVNTNSDTDALGSNFLSLREAVNAINTASTAGMSAAELAQCNLLFGFGSSRGDSVRFADSLAGQTITLSKGEITIQKSMSIVGTNQPGGITISGNNASRIFNVDEGTNATIDVSISNLALTDGKAGSGGGITNRENLTVNNCLITNCQATGAVGSAIQSLERLFITNSTISNCTTATQATIFAGGTDFSLISSTVVQNKSLTANTAGIQFSSTLTSSTLINCIVAANTNTNSSISVNVGAPGGFNLTTSKNNILGNQPNIANLQHGVNGNISGNNGTGTIDISTVILPTLANNGGPTKSYALSAGSLALNRGSTTSLTADQRGLPYLRTVGSAPDIGAFESQNPNGAEAGVTFTVTIAADENDGNFAASDLSLREAMLLANSHPGKDTILFAPSLTGKTLTLQNSLPSINDELDLIGPGRDKLIVLRDPAANQFRLITNFKNSSIQGLTLRGGELEDSTGGILNSGGLFLNDVHVSQNKSIRDEDSAAGGIDNQAGGNLVILNCVISENVTTGSGNSGGGLLNRPGGIVTIQDSLITVNTAEERGGGIANFGSMQLVNSILSNNKAKNGGGLFNQTGDATIIGSQVRENNATNGGGVFVQSGKFNLSNTALDGNTAGSVAGLSIQADAEVGIFSSTISRNKATLNTGAIRNLGILSIDRSTISGNTLTFSDPGVLGISNAGNLIIQRSTITGNNSNNNVVTGGIDNGGAGTVLLTETILAGNICSGVDVSFKGTNVLAQSGFNLIGPGSSGGLTNGVNGNLVGVDAKLAPLANRGGPTETHALLFGSPALNAGDPTSTFSTDQRGLSKNGTRDIGAFEVQAITLAPSTLSSGTINVAYSQQVTSNTPTLPPGQTYTYTLASGALPNGLTLSTSGLIAGTPTAQGSFNFSILSTAATGDFSTQAFTITIGDASNTPPTISNIANQASTGPAIANIPFTVGDAQTAAGSLTLSRTTSNPTLVPLNNIAFGGSGANRTVTVTPAAGQFGTATITITVTDAGGLTASDSFLVTVNTPPSISDIANQTSTGGPISNVPFTIADVQTQANSLVVSAKSSNATLVPVGNITFGGSNANRTISLAPAAGQTGTSTITVTVTDAGGLTASDTFVVTVSNPPNASPTISDVANQSSTGAAIGPLDFVIDDNETPAANLVVTRSTSNPALVPLANVVLGGSGTARTVTVTPVAGQFGSTTITLTVTDGGGKTATDTFVVTVTNPANANSPLLVGFKQFAAGTDVGDGSVRFYNADGTIRFSLTPFPGQPGGVRTAAGDFTGDGIADLVVGTGPGGPTHVKVFNGATQAEIFTIDPFEPTFTGGIYLAVGDITGDGIADLTITPDEGGGPRCRAFSGGNNFSQLADFFGIDDPNFRGGARSAIGDLNGDGRGDLLVVAGFGGGPRVAAFDGKTLASNGGPKLFNDFFAFEQTLRNGIFVAAGDVNGDGFADLVAAGGPGGGPRVFILDGKSLVQNGSNSLVPVGNFFAGDVNNRGGIRVAVKNLDNDGRADVVTGAGTGAGSRVTAYRGTNISPTGGTPPAFLDFDAFAGFTGGVFVG